MKAIILLGLFLYGDRAMGQAPSMAPLAPSCLQVHEEILKSYKPIYHKYVNTPQGIAGVALYRNQEHVLKLLVAPGGVSMEGLNPSGVCYTGKPGGVGKESYNLRIFYILKTKLELVNNNPKYREI